MRSADGEFVGYMVDMLERISETFQSLSQPVAFKYEIRLVADGKYGAQNPDGTWNGMIGELVRGVYVRSVSVSYTHLTLPTIYSV